MRVSSAYRSNSYLSAIDSTSERLSNTENIVSTRKQLNTASDNPSGMKQVLSMRSMSSKLTQYNKNISTASTRLGFVDNTLSSVTSLINKAKTYAQTGATATTDQDARNTLADQVATLQESLVNLGNTQGANGEYIYGGQKSTQAPFTASNGTITFSGDTNDVTIAVSDTNTMTVSTSGQKIVDVYNSLEQLRQDLLNGNTSAISDTDLASLSDQSDAILAERGAVGTKVDLLSSMKTQNESRITSLKSHISDIEDADTASALVDYQNAYNAYTAALTISSKGFDLSLANYI